MALPGTFFAWLSDSASSPSTRFNQLGGPFIRTDGQTVANDWADLIDGTLALPINASGNNFAWSNTLSDGTAAAGSACSDWTSNSSGVSARGGQSGQTSAIWSDSLTANCNASLRVYCVQQ